MSVRTDSPHPHPSDASSMQSLHVALSADVMQVHCAWLCQDSAKFKKLAEKVLTDMGGDLIAKTSFLYMPSTKLRTKFRALEGSVLPSRCVCAGFLDGFPEVGTGRCHFPLLNWMFLAITAKYSA